MAAIAKFISYDGGIAFSERAMKIQRRDEDPVIISLDEVLSMRVRRPLEDSDGFIRIDISDGRRYRLSFDDDQLSEAVEFQRAFDATTTKDSFHEDRPSEMVEMEAALSHAVNGRRFSQQQERKRGQKEERRRWRFHWWYVLVFMIVVGLVSYMAVRIYEEIEFRRVSHEAEKWITYVDEANQIEKIMDYYNDGAIVSILDSDGDGEYSVYCGMQTYIPNDSIGSYVKAFSRVATEICAEHGISVSEYELSMIQDGIENKTVNWTSTDGIRGDFLYLGPDNTWLRLENAGPEDIEAELGVDTFGYNFGLD